MDKNPFLKYVMKDNKEDIFHSSAYGKAQNADGMGTASTETFAARRATESNRQFVKSYGDSRIGSASNPACRAKTYTPPKNSTPIPRPVMPKNPGISR